MSALYHQTLAVNVTRVLRDGLLPRSRHDGEKVWPERAGVGVHPDAVYLVGSAHDAFWRCCEDGGDAIIRVDASAIDPGLLTIDPEALDSIVCEDWPPRFNFDPSLMALLEPDSACLAQLADGDSHAAVLAISNQTRWPLLEYCLRRSLPMLYLSEIPASAVSIVDPAQLAWDESGEYESADEERERCGPVKAHLTRADWPAMLPDLCDPAFAPKILAS